MVIKGIPCTHGNCGHTSGQLDAHLLHGALHFTASVMGNPEYLEATKNLPQAKDQRMDGIERVNSFHASAHERRVMRQERAWGKP